MLSSATQLKTHGERDCKTPVPGDNFKANLALDTPKPLLRTLYVLEHRVFALFGAKHTRITPRDPGKYVKLVGSLNSHQGAASCQRIYPLACCSAERETLPCRTLQHLFT
jgi:hypothetical protein